jgi:dihydroxyacetone kinase phosphoprotein-dependent L subunit
VTSTFDAPAVRRWVDQFLELVDDEADALGDLDRLAGDGDFGKNMRTVVNRARATLSDLPAGSAPRVVLSAVSDAFLATGGTSGPLFGIWFRELGAAAGDAANLDVATIARGVTAGTQAVRRLGGAEVGDKTMIDALQPAGDALSLAENEGVETGDALQAAARAARAGAAATEGMTARRGRASYVGDSSVGVVDPGSVVVALLFESAASAVADTRYDTIN